ncbi:PAS domain S-box protein [Novosphingobium lindaniclasticum]|uniref:PAS domain S-box protein n=1 Tax=Novosphingobium lindaniclasticum TaxID=1329895 RepID=UPI0003FC9EF7|nr:PAS domain S-box protein [Novosphingobium lindaniclasticum]
MTSPSDPFPLGAGVEDVLTTAELASRPSRVPDYEAESRALGLLAHEMATNPRGVLQKCAEMVMDLCRADSAGISILEPGGTSGMFRWHAAAGAFAPNLFGMMPREASPCGTVMERDRVLLFKEAERVFPALRDVEPRIYENLLAPWHVKGEAVGTLWVIKHTPQGRFDAEDARVLQSLARFAAAALQMISAIDAATVRQAELEQRTDALSEIEERQTFLLRLSDAVRPLATPADIQGAITDLLRERLNADWCYYVDWDSDTNAGLVLRGSVREGLPTLAGVHDVSDAPEFLELLTGGAVLMVRDYASYEKLPRRLRQKFTAFGFRSMIVAPLFARGRLVASLLVGDTKVREWSASDSSLLVEVAERTWAAIERACAEETLRGSEERFRLIVENARDYAIFTLDADGRIADLFPGAEQVFGWSQAEARGQAADITFTAEDRAAGVPAQEQATARDNGMAPDVRWHVRKDGSRVFIEGTTNAIRDPTGKLRGYLKIGQDVTERRAAEQALRESEERFRQFSEASSDIIWVRNAETMAFEYVSPAFETIYGRTRALVGDELERWASTLHPDDRDRVLANLDRVRAGERVDYEFRIVRPDGEERWIEDVDFPLRDSDGRITRIGGIGHDATIGKQAAGALEESERRARTLMEGIPQLVWRSEDEGRWTWSSPQWQDCTGQTQEESLGLGWLEALHPDDRETAVQAWGAARQNGIIDIDFRVRRARDAAFIWHHTRSVPVRDEQGRIVEWLGTSTDVHVLREMQERQRVLVAELQHRTFNLMGMVRSTADATIRSSASLDEFKAMFRERIAALARVQRLLSRLSEADRVTFDELIRTELEAAGALEPDSRVTLAGPEGVALRSSTVQTFAMALHELTTNAVKYGALKQPGAHLSVRWHIERRNADQPWLHVDWQETGVVMASTSAKPQGTGQGRRLIEEALPYQLNAETTYVMADDGVRCSIALPVSARNLRS